MADQNEKKGFSLSAFSILYIILLILAVITWLIPGDEVKGATLSTIVMATYNGFADALDVNFFVLVLGGFIGIVMKTGALDAGVAHLVKKLKGRELVLIPILMTLFSIGGTTYGMAEETVAFYGLLAFTMVAAGFDSMVGAATVLLGAGAGVLGSTVNPFSTGIASDTANSVFKQLATTMGEGNSFVDLTVNNGQVILIGVALWLSTLAISIAIVMSYAKKVKEDKGSIILSLQEQEIMNREFSKPDGAEDIPYTSRMNFIMILFAFTFVVMIIAVIPWKDAFGIEFSPTGWTSWLVGVPFGDWWFGELGMWFFIMGIIIAIINRFTESEIVDAFITGAMDILSVVLIIAVARGASVLMGETGLDKYILTHSADALRGLSAAVFAPMSYILYMVLSFLIPSTSGLAVVSMPVMAPLAVELGYNPAVMVMIFAAAAGLINLFTPTSGVVMGGLAMAKIEYTTWLKFVTKTLVIIFITNVIILTGAMMIL